MFSTVSPGSALGALCERRCPRPRSGAALAADPVSPVDLRCDGSDVVAPRDGCASLTPCGQFTYERRGRWDLLGSLTMHDAVGAGAERGVLANRHCWVTVGLESGLWQQCDAEADCDEVLYHDVVIADVT